MSLTSSRSISSNTGVRSASSFCFLYLTVYLSNSDEWDNACFLLKEPKSLSFPHGGTNISHTSAKKHNSSLHRILDISLLPPLLSSMRQTPDSRSPLQNLDIKIRIRSLKPLLVLPGQ